MDNYPSAPGGVPLSPRVPWGSVGMTSSSSDEPALEDSSSLSANTDSRGLELAMGDRACQRGSTHTHMHTNTNTVSHLCVHTHIVYTY